MRRPATRRDAGAHPLLAHHLPGPRHPLDLHRRLPGETEEEFEELLTWLKEAKLERVGCFQYEPVRGAPRTRWREAVPDEVKAERQRRFMETQQAVSLKLQKAKVGKRLPVIIDAAGPTVAKGRSKYDARRSTATSTSPSAARSGWGIS